MYCKVNRQIHEEIKSYKCDQDVHVCTEWNDGMTNSLPWIIPSPLFFFMDMGYTFFLTCLVSMWHTFFGHASFIFGMPCRACGIPSLGMHLFYFLHVFWTCGIPSLGMHLFIFYSPYHLLHGESDHGQNKEFLLPG